MSCYLRISGLYFNVDGFLKESGLTPDKIYRRGDLLNRIYPACHLTQGVQFTVSSAGMTNFKEQVADAISFLNNNAVALICLKNYYTNGLSSLDFGIETRMFRLGAQFDYFPAALIMLAGHLGFGIELSQYPPPLQDKRCPDKKRHRNRKKK